MARAEPLKSLVGGVEMENPASNTVRTKKKCRGYRCPGAIVIRTDRVLIDLSPGAVRIGGPNPTKEVQTAHCDKCGILYDVQTIQS